jgi:hypothetical protein
MEVLFAPDFDEKQLMDEDESEGLYDQSDCSSDSFKSDISENEEECRGHLSHSQEENNPVETPKVGNSLLLR